jgi:hypothetical protein
VSCNHTTSPFLFQLSAFFSTVCCFYLLTFLAPARSLFCAILNIPICLWVYHICRPESCTRHTANCERGKCAMRILSLCDTEAQSIQTATHATTGRAILFFEEFCEVLYGATAPNDGSDHPPAPVSLDAPAPPAWPGPF